MGVKRCLHRSHRPDFRRRPSQVEPAALGPTDAVLGRDRPSELSHPAQNRFGYLLVGGGQSRHVYVDVAVGCMAETPGLGLRRGFRHQRRDAIDKRGQLDQGKGHVELVRGSETTDRLGVTFSVLPQLGPPNLVDRHCCTHDSVEVVDSRGQQELWIDEIGDLHQQDDWGVRSKWSGQTRGRANELDPRRGHELDRLQAR